MVIGPISSEIRMMTKYSLAKDEKLKELKNRIRRKNLEDRQFNRQEPRMFYSKVCDYQADHFISSWFFSSSAELSTIAGVGEFTDDTN